MNLPEYKFNGISIRICYWWFSVSVEKSKSKLGKRIRLIFGTCLHIRDKDLLLGMSKYFSNLNLVNGINKDISVHCNENKKIAHYFDIQNKIIPFFKKYHILGIKSKDFEDFKEVAELVKNKEHWKD